MARTRQCAKFPFRCCSRKSGVPSNSTSWETLCLLPHLNCTGSGVAPPADSSVPPALATFELHPGLSVDPSLAALAQWQLMQTAATAESEVTSLRHQRWHRPEPPNPFK
uniref:Uncharacterized protein n=1 Tax=Dunaliella tertiolecta TaxID=3047 RepID=A0A7S3QQS2_DUNTE|eukprot:CAMPEP_0202384734 /NCGR_PEP_ID=MMETSP1127-20130417/56853_1 /ASSEMBLY_ACC=CAM_ASM_000462 /TAXON_ID=3047 /ORGANISM="Dunaliella tertiolecta, Strain CCMP1320" /LENGTH=108 /DNA_ID=CAMNT_0048984663 /DNA_START=147 /DNA_END=473 /DNA_ORIENTATION=+